MPGIADALEAPLIRNGRPAILPQHLAAMPDDLRVKAEELLASDRSNQFVSVKFTESGYPISTSAVRNYRIEHGLRSI